MKKAFLVAFCAMLLFATACTKAEDSAPEETPEGSIVETEVPAGFKQETVTFPASEAEKTEDNAEIFEIEPFTVTFVIPENWELKLPEDGEKTYAWSLWSPVNIYQDGVCIGSIAYNTFTVYPEADGAYRSVYNQIMLSPHVTWDNDYTPIITTEAGEIATCEVRYDATGYSAAFPGETALAESETVYNKGVLAYNTEKLVYIGIQIEANAVSAEEFNTIAESIQL